MERAERLLNLVALLLDAQEPVPWAEIRAHFREEYSGTDAAAERKFERDKAELLEVGIPLRYVQGDDEVGDGYVLDRESYYLPELNLSPEEWAVLYTAGSAALASGAFPGSQDLSHSLRKVGFLAGKDLPSPNVRLSVGHAESSDQLSQKLESLWAAIGAKKWVEMDYFSPTRGQVSSRRVDPYGLALRRGEWQLVGRCHLRQEVRTFLVHRIRSLRVNGARPKSADFSVPEGFSLKAHLASHPWEHRFHPPLEVRLSLAEDLVPLAERLFPGAQASSPGEITLSATFLDGLCRYALSLAPRVKVLSPPEAVARWREMGRAVQRRHAERVGGAP